MKKNRYLLCLLLCGVMLYFAVPRLSIRAEGVEGVFTISWLLFALIVVAGNFSALLFAPKKRVQRVHSAVAKRKSRSF
ncbi:hypothetical protein [Bacillus rubiinfantis]|uniref:hypothetical protein n=1 Tax=Bacillus rubiinfantis TaxID=1499680 RepID=UPI0005A9468A|nr:hypothetical protein [Bacillus rubiinfantis]